MKRPIAFGEDLNGGFEFGDLCHVIAMILCDPEIPVAISIRRDDYHAYREFLQSLGARNLSTITPNEYEDDRHLPTDKRVFKSVRITADVIKGWVCEHGEEAFRRKCFRLSKSLDEDAQSKLHDYLHKRLGSPSGAPAVLVWLRNSSLYSMRNSSLESVEQLQSALRDLGCRPILIGQSLDNHRPDSGNLLEWYDDPSFKEIPGDQVVKQFVMFRILRKGFQVVASTGMMSGGMDATGFFANVPVFFFAAKKKGRSRMDKICEVSHNFSAIYIDLPQGKTFESFSEGELEDFKRQISEVLSKRAHD